MLAPNPSRDSLPVAVIGGGPIGLAAVAHLLARGETPLLLEAGPGVGTHIRAWGHVRLFSPWRYLVDPASVALLESSGWTMPNPDALPSGAELAERYLEPLAALPAIEPHVRTSTRVLSVTRRGLDRMKSDGREDAPFVLRTRSADGAEDEVLARAVIDASGTYGSPNPLGASGVPALGEAQQADRVYYGIPDVLGRDRARYAGRRVLVVGSGHSAFNVLLDLAVLAEQEPATKITWAVRRAGMGQLFGGESRDELPARGALGRRMRELVEQERVRFASLRIARIARTADGLVVSGEGSALPAVDEIVATTGFRPDLALLRELRLDLDPAVEAPTALGPLIDPNVHSCGSVPPHGERELRHPERGVYVVGMKSYGRAPTFLLLTGYEQVRSVVAAIAGDDEAARNVELVLPQTGVCSSDLAGTAAQDADPASILPIVQVGRAEEPAVGRLAAVSATQLPVLQGAAERSCCESSCCS